MVSRPTRAVDEQKRLAFASSLNRDAAHAVRHGYLPNDFFY
jgi:hypothetical protein